MITSLERPTGRSTTSFDTNRNVIQFALLAAGLCGSSVAGQPYNREVGFCEDPAFSAQPYSWLDYSCAENKVYSSTDIGQLLSQSLRNGVNEEALYKMIKDCSERMVTRMEVTPHEISRALDKHLLDLL